MFFTSNICCREFKNRKCTLLLGRDRHNCRQEEVESLVKGNGVSAGGGRWLHAAMQMSSVASSSDNMTSPAFSGSCWELSEALHGSSNVLDTSSSFATTMTSPLRCVCCWRPPYARTLYNNEERASDVFLAEFLANLWLAELRGSGEHNFLPHLGHAR